jgi:transposase
MFRDLPQWLEIRRRVLVEGLGKRAACREYGIHYKTLKKILTYPQPPGYRAKVPRPRPKLGPFLGRLASILEEDKRRPAKWRRPARQIYRDLRARGYQGGYSCVRDYLAGRDTPNVEGLDNEAFLDEVLGSTHGEARALLQVLSTIPARRLSARDWKAIREKLGWKRAKKGEGGGTRVYEAAHRWMLRALQCKEPASKIRAEVGEIRDLDSLLRSIRTGALRDRNKALAVLADHRGVSFRSIARFLHIQMQTVSEYCSTYRLFGYERLIKGFYDRSRRADDESLQDALFSILHTPPRDYDINRTTWRQVDLKRVLEGQVGYRVSRDTIREIVKEAGYRWKHARTVLTSPDPDYREKLAKIQAILSTLGPNERFFSIDEFGPFAVKMQGGRCLMPPGEVRVVPQRQKSKGWLILTGALELSTNQVTHFYSEKKNTAEMIRLLEVLLEQYDGCDKIYLSWDAASWHASKKLNKRVEEINSAEYRAQHSTPLVELAPLPASAQFLNVIESVFSGMAKAILHISDYESVETCKAAIDRYFAERNEQFRVNPRRAGRIIWGREIAPSRFSASHNCKSPKYQYVGP